MAIRKALTGFTIGILMVAASASANAQEFVSTHGDWSVFTINKGGSKVCYMASAPVKNTGNFSKRGAPYALVTSRNASTDEFSASSGYPYKTGEKVRVEIDGTKFELFPKDELAWAYDIAQDSRMVTAMKKGNRMTVRGVSPKDTYSLDTYSLRGATAAYNKMKSMCN
ncbi:MAG: invasion associated locus B family protein [Alphaproteobacteria bacterium]|nr:invasion associated locus B family protein [Alphaproteobacteria bacterium]